MIREVIELRFDRKYEVNYSEVFPVNAEITMIEWILESGTRLFIQNRQTSESPHKIVGAKIYIQSNNYEERTYEIDKTRWNKSFFEKIKMEQLNFALGRDQTILDLEELSGMALYQIEYEQYEKDLSEWRAEKERIEKINEQRKGTYEELMERYKQIELCIEQRNRILSMPKKSYSTSSRRSSIETSGRPGTRNEYIYESPNTGFSHVHGGFYVEGSSRVFNSANEASQYAANNATVRFVDRGGSGAPMHSVNPGMGTGHLTESQRQAALGRAGLRDQASQHGTTILRSASGNTITRDNRTGTRSTSSSRGSSGPTINFVSTVASIVLGR